jgi:GT2 family glycosyltransferase
MSGPEQRVAAVVVSYNVRELLVACVTSLVAARAIGELGDVVVVDNGSTDCSATTIRRRFPGVRVIDAPNLGYGAGANIGMAATRSRYVLVLNADTVVPPGTVNVLAAYLDAHQETAVVGPLLRYPDGTVQPSRRRFPKRLTALFESTIVEEWWPGNRWVRDYRMLDQPIAAVGAPEEVDWVVGAALLVRRAALDRLGGFDESFRMYAEEVEWCWRFHRHGWRVAYLPAAEVLHHEGASSARDLTARQLEFDTSRVRLVGRLYGRRQAQLTRSGLLLNYALLLLRESAKWLIGHRRELRRARMSLYLRTLRGGLREGIEDRR